MGPVTMVVRSMVIGGGHKTETRYRLSLDVLGGVYD